MFVVSVLAVCLSALGVASAGRGAAVGARGSAGGAPAFVHAFVKREGILAISKNDGKSTQGVGIVPLALSSDKQSYYAVISAGNISFRVSLDSGSADTWLISSECRTENCKKVPRYPLSYKSPSFESVNNNETVFSVSFADGTSASGFVALETIQLSNSNITADQQAFGVVKKTDVAFPDQISGVLGLGFPRLSSIDNNFSGGIPFIATLAQRGLLSYPIFGLFLARNDSGSFTVGGVDSAIVKSSKNIVWNDVAQFSPFGSERNTSGYLQWAIPLNGFSVNGTSSFVPQATYAKDTGNLSFALLDVGTPGIFGPYQDVARIFSAIPEARLVDDQVGQWAIPCHTRMTMAFQFGDANFTLQPSDYLIGPTVGNPELCLAWPRATQPSSDGIDWQFGSAFLRTVYSIFSYGINRKEPPMVGLLPLTASAAALESTEAVDSFLASAGTTVTTTLPNFLLATPTPTVPAYIFNTSVPASLGGVVSSDLATSTYSPLLTNTAQLKESGLPVASFAPTLQTFIITDSEGVHTSTSTVATPDVTLGAVPGQGVPEDNASTRGAGASLLGIALSSCFVIVLWTL